MRGKHLWLIVTLLVLIANGGVVCDGGQTFIRYDSTLKALPPVQYIDAQQALHKPCNVAVWNASTLELVETIIRMIGLRGVGLKVLASLSTVTIEPGRDRPAWELLDMILLPRGYTYYALGTRIYVERRMVKRGVGRGTGYIRNLTTRQLTSLTYSPLKAEEEAARRERREMEIMAQMQAIKAKGEAQAKAREARRSEELYQAQLAFYRRPIVVNVEASQTINIRNMRTYWP